MQRHCSPSALGGGGLLLLWRRRVAVELGVVDAGRPVHGVRRRLVVPPRLRRDDEGSSAAAAATAAAEGREGRVARPRVAAAPDVRPLPAKRHM